MANNVRTQTNFKPPSKKTIVIFAIVAFIFLFGSSFKSIATFFVEKMLFSSLGQGDTFNKLLSAKYFIHKLSFVIMTFVCVFIIFLTNRNAKHHSTQNKTDVFMTVPASIFKTKPVLIRNIISIIVGAFFASTTYGYYKEWILFRNGSNTGIKDATFKKDIGFYLFKLPFIQVSLTWLFTALIVLILISVLSLLLTGGLRLEANKRHISTYGRILLSVLLFLTTLVKAAEYYFEKFSLVHSTRGAIDGATYTDINAQIPALRLMVFVAIIASILFLVNVFRKGIVLPLVALGLWLAVGLVVGTVYPAVIQRFVVTPSRNTKEKPYAKQNIEATKAAYDLDTIESSNVNYEQTISPETAQSVKAALANVTLFDESSVAPYIQQKRGTQYYEFGVGDRDRYTVDGKVLPSIISSRELVAASNLPDKSWQSIHSVYTHGFGAVALNSSEVLPDSAPDYLVADLPNVTEKKTGNKSKDTSSVVKPATNSLSLDTSKARVYFGEGLNDFVFVGSKKEQTPTTDKFDLAESTGVKLDSFLKKAVFALNYADYNIMISDVVNKDTKIIYDRNPAQRVKTIAPFLDIDSDPYPVITNNEIVWVVDAYTTSNQYPNSQYLDQDNLDFSSSLNKRINYVRNSVKATVNARTGEVNLYVIDQKDPIIKAYEKAFPKLFKKESEVPKDIVDHYRYPNDIFDVQSQVLADYHVSDATTLLKSSNKWQAAPDLAGTGTTTQITTVAEKGGRADKLKSVGTPIPGLYQYISHTAMEKPEFVLTRSFTPIGETFKMESYLSVSSDPGSYGKMRLVNFKSTADASALTPTQIVGQINGDEAFSRNKTLLGQQGSSIVPGALQIIPVGNTVVYVQPQFVQGDSADSRPVLKYVTVSVSGLTVCAASIDEAVDMLISGKQECSEFAAVSLPLPGSTPKTDTVTTDTTVSTPSSDISKLSDKDLVNALAQARADYDKAQNPVDLGALQKAADKMAKFIDELERRNK